MALYGYLDFDMTLTCNWKFNIRNGFCIHENSLKVVLYIILR